jgi:hypothetical protein
LKPWKAEGFKLSNDPDFEAKLADVVGLYMNPPERAVVFSFDEKTQCQGSDPFHSATRLRPLESAPCRICRSATVAIN